MSYARQAVERVIFSSTDYTESELSEMDVDELEFVAEVLGHTDTNFDTDQLHAAIADLKSNNE